MLGPGIKASGQTGDDKSERRRLLGISKIKWTGMGEFNSDDHYNYYCGQDSLRRNVRSQQESEMQY